MQLLQLSRPITNRITQSFFDKVQGLAWHTLEAELPRFLPSVERLSYEGSSFLVSFLCFVLFGFFLVTFLLLLLSIFIYSLFRTKVPFARYLAHRAQAHGSGHLYEQQTKRTANLTTTKKDIR